MRGSHFHRLCDDPSGLSPTDHLACNFKYKEARLSSIIARDRVTACPERDIVDQDVVPAHVRKQAIDDIDKAQYLRLDTGLFTQFPSGGIDGSLTGLDSPTRKAPFSQSRRCTPANQEDLVVTQTDDADGWDGVGPDHSALVQMVSLLFMSSLVASRARACGSTLARSTAVRDFMAQSVKQDIVIISIDPAFKAFAVETLW